MNQLTQIVKESGTLFRKGFLETKQITYKGAVDLLTEYDVAIEKELTAKLKDLFPDFTIVGEESWEGGEIPKNAVIIDPIDGTTNFVHHIPFCAISVGVWEDGEPKYGVVYNPVLDELFTAKKGGGAYLNGEKIHVSNTNELQKSLIATGFPYTKSEGGDDFLWAVQKIKAVLPHTRDVRRLGAASVDLCYTAKGVFDGYYEINLKPWDTAAGVLVVQEAGGKISNTEGGKYSLSDKGIIASSSAIHEKFVELLTSDAI